MRRRRVKIMHYSFNGKILHLHRILILLAMACVVAPAQSTAPAPSAGVANSGAPQADSVPGPVANAAYVLQPGDDIEIRAYNIPELDQAVRIRPDGKISMLLLNDVQAAGYTADRLGETLSTAFARHYRNPRISVIVRGFSSQSVYVGGEVLRPGLIPLSGNTTALQAVVMAGGLKETSQGSKVTLLRRGEAGEPTTVNLDVDSIVSKREPDMALRAGDILYVPKTNISVYVGGEVMHPGLLPLNGELTVMGAVFQAGGLKETAQSNTVMVVRNTGDGPPLVMKLRLDDAVRGKAVASLQPFDVVYVPRSTISRIDRFVDQYLRQVIPINVSAGFSYLFGSALVP
jgi:protein involved in polysaccharide export with SLBB domain